LILVLVGLERGFPRLVKKMDKISYSLEEKVIIQIGNTDYKPKNAEFMRFVTREEIEGYYRNARIVVSHAGIGTILSAHKYNKPIIIVPRRKEYQEHLDDHQMEIAEKLEKEKIGIVVYDVKNLREAIKSPEDKGMKRLDNENKLITNLKNYLSTLEGDK